ncbi:MAG: D-lyxose/D-mannose family sugar isomerase [Treponema sp.]|jgi:D-lyxose ketol-isomerase|nr:D-lyxose/D-mannose family sugar isomerase [Treponema sp.]
MKRSLINSYIRETEIFLEKTQFALPPFSFWTAEDWSNKGLEYNEIINNQLGWDLTDFGRGDFENCGLLLFTIRNGNVKKPYGKSYAEKILIVKQNQITPFHFHKSKMEDIINRTGTGCLKVQLYHSLNDKTLDKYSDVPVSVDGRNFTVKAGAVISLKKGESITLQQGIFHQFWTEDEMLLLGEVSMVNNDHRDNFFCENIGRFPVIEEDEKPYRLLVGDYKKYLKNN